ncbi:MAG: tetratricopeptide repeat protein [Candidatus Binataceae bacterium]
MKALSLATLAALCIWGLPVSGCTTRADMDQLNQNQLTLRSMIAAERQRTDALEQRIVRLSDEIVQLKHNAESAETGGNDVKALKDRIAKLEGDLSSMQATAAAGPARGAADGEGATPAPVAVAPADIPPTWPDELDQAIMAAGDSRDQGVKVYRQGLAAMKEGNYSAAVVKFASLQKTYPKSPLVEPAGYFAANALYELGRHDQAILQFNDLVMRYPKGRYASAALLRQAQAFLKLNDRIDARLTLQKLVADFAGTTEASAGNKLLKDLVGG